MSTRDTAESEERPSALRAWLAESAPFSPRRHSIILLVIVALGLIRGLFWVVATEVWNPIDEIQHYDYARSIATGHGMPVVGDDEVTDEILMTAKVSPTFWFHYEPVQPTVADPSWGATKESYEGGGVQGPLYYALMTVPYWLSHPFGILPSLYALRLASVVVSLLAVPLAWVLAREIFPKRPAVWLATPALLVMLQGFNANLASVNNDALMVPIAVAALIPVARTWRGLTFRQAAVAGALFALAMLTKPTNLAIAPLVGIPLVAYALLRRESILGVVRWALVFGGVAFLVMVPYLAWNLYEYHALSATQEVNAITGPVQGKTPLTLDALRLHLRNARTGFFEFQPYSTGPDNDYNRILERVAVVTLVIGTAAALARRRLGEGAALAWLGLAFPLAFLSKIAMTYGLLDSVGSVVGRHLYAALVPTCIVIAGGVIIALGPRWGGVALLLVMALALGAERDMTLRYVDVSYATGLVGDSGPRVDQSWNDEYVTNRTVKATPSCPVEIVGLGISGSPPPVVDVAQGSTHETAQIVGSDGNVGLYRLQEPLSNEFQVLLPAGTALGSSRQEREAAVAFVEGPGDPMVRLYCRTDDAKAERFEQRYGPQHPGIVTYHRIRDWTSIWEWLGWATFALGTVAALGWEIRRKLRRSPT